LDVFRFLRSAWFFGLMLSILFVHHPPPLFHSIKRLI
jgi:hypothetical protein